MRRRRNNEEVQTVDAWMGGVCVIPDKSEAELHGWMSMTNSEMQSRLISKASLRERATFWPQETGGVVRF